MNESMTTHPLGVRAKVLLSSVFGPFARVIHTKLF